MRHETQVELIRRLLRHREARTTDMDADVVASPVARYTDGARLTRERGLFSSLPVAVAAVSELTRPGEFVTRDVAGVSLLVTRGQDGELRAFLNVCRHRGTQLVDQRRGCQKAFVCPYHAWTYESDGRLASVRHDAGFPGVMAERGGLVEIAAREAYGLVWVQREGKMPELSTHLGGVADDLATLGLESHHVYRPRTLHKRIGWKLALDIFLEGYHVSYAHRRTIAPMFIDNLNLFDRFEPHIRAVLPKKSLTTLADGDEATWRLRTHANILYLLFPNTLMLVQPDHVGMFHVYPESLTESRIEAYTLLPEAPASDKARDYWDRNLEILYTALEEDFALGESIQRGLTSGANESLVFGRYEQSLAWFHASVDARTV